MTTVHIAGEGRRRRLTRDQLDKLRAVTRCRLRTGAGGAVATGQDRFAALGPNPDFQADCRQGCNPPIGPIATREQPVIAAVNGIAAGANIARQGIGPAPGAP